MLSVTEVALTQLGRIKLTEITRNIIQGITLRSIKVSDIRLIIGDVAYYISNNLEGTLVDVLPFVLITQNVESIFMINYVGYIDNAMFPYPNYIPQSFGIYDDQGDLIFVGNLNLSSFVSRFIIGRIDLVNVTSDITSRITGDGLYNDYLTAQRIFQLITTPPVAQTENQLFSLRSLDGTINKVAVRFNNEVFYLGFDEVTGTIVST